jgi:hypothetical protein
MTRKIIIYNSFVHDANPHATLLTRQLAEVDKELLDCPARDRKALLNERRLIRTKLQSRDAIGQKSVSEMSVQELKAELAFMQREGFQNKSAYKPRFNLLVSELQKRDNSQQKDGMGSPEEIAYGLGWHARSNEVSPYDEPLLTKAWESGRKAAKQRSSMRRGQYMGELREGKIRFEPPRPRQTDVTPSGSPSEYTEWVKLVKKTHPKAEPYGNTFMVGIKVVAEWLGSTKKSFIAPPKRVGSQDFKSEKGYVAKLIDVKTGSVLAKSEPYISNGAGLKSWIQTKAQELISRGKRVKAEVVIVFFDPDLAHDAVTRVVTPHEYKTNVSNGKWVEVTSPSKAWFGASAQVKINGVLTHLRIEGDTSGLAQDSGEFARRERVRLKTPKPLPSGKTVSLVGLVDFIRPDGLIEVRVITPGLYGGGIMKVRPEEIERV